MFYAVLMNILISANNWEKSEIISLRLDKTTRAPARDPWRCAWVGGGGGGRSGHRIVTKTSTRLANWLQLVQHYARSLVWQSQGPGLDRRQQQQHEILKIKREIIQMMWILQLHYLVSIINFIVFFLPATTTTTTTSQMLGFFILLEHQADSRLHLVSVRW